MDEGLVGRVRQVIAQSGLGQNEFAGTVGLEPSKMSKSLSGVRRFTSLELALIAQRGQVTVDWLLSGVGAPPAALAARATEVRASSVEAAADRAEHLEDLWSSLIEMDAVPDGDIEPVSLVRPAGGRMVDQGRDLAQSAWAAVLDAGMEDRFVEDLPGVLERSFRVHVAVEHLGEGLDGFSYRRGGFRLALVSADSAWTRQRFTLAHELGHLLAGDGDGLRIDTDVMAAHVRQDRIEMRANAFAASFLMPADMLRRDVGDSLTEHDFARLVGRLRVSPSALAWRMKNLSLIDETRRARFTGIGARASALLGGWSDEFRILEAERGATRPCMRMVRAALVAYESAAASVRPLAAILGRPPEEVLSALQPEEEPGTSDVLEPGEPIFTP